MPLRVCHSEGLLSLDAYLFLTAYLHCNVAAAKPAAIFLHQPGGTLPDSAEQSLAARERRQGADSGIRMVGTISMRRHFPLHDPGSLDWQRDFNVVPDTYTSASAREGGSAGEIEVAEMYWLTCVASASRTGGGATETGRSVSAWPHARTPIRRSPCLCCCAQRLPGRCICVQCAGHAKQNGGLAFDRQNMYDIPNASVSNERGVA